MKKSEYINETRCVSTCKYYSDLDAIRQSKVFSVLDVTSAHLRIETEKRDRKMTAFSMPQAHFHFNKMCFGLMLLLRLTSDVWTPYRDKWVPVTTAWRVLRLRMEERPPIWRVAANILNKQSRTADNGWFSSFEVRRGANNSP